MSNDKYAKVLRILDDQNRLVERADAKAISLLSTLGIFTAIFISTFTNIHINPVSITFMAIYFIGAILSIYTIILAISPRIRIAKVGKTEKADETAAYQPTFFAGISKYADATAYKNNLDLLLSDESNTTYLYVHQIYEVAKINTLKYKYVQRAVWLVVVTLAVQLTLIIITFADRLVGSN